VLRINGITYENVFKSLSDWTLKKFLIAENAK
jgi:hypothetical protein